MTTVTGYTTDHVDGIEDRLIASAHVDGSGHLILVKEDTTTLDAGSVWNAVPDASTTVKGIVELADGTETTAGTDATRAVTPQGLKVVTDVLNTAITGKQAADTDLTAIAGLTGMVNGDMIGYQSSSWVKRTAVQVLADIAARANSNASVTLTNPNNTTSILEKVTLINDGSATTAWPNRVEHFYDATVGGGAPKLVSFLNEYFEYRFVPAKYNTVGLRGFLRNSTSDTARDMTIPVIEIMDDRGSRNHIWGVYGDGIVKIAAGEIATAYVVVLVGAAAIPTGTPAGTLIVRT